MFHGVHPHGWPARLVGRSRSPGLNQQLVLSLLPLHATRPDLCKNLGMSPWGATTRLINRGHDTPYPPRPPRIIYVLIAIGKLDGFSTWKAPL